MKRREFIMLSGIFALMNTKKLYSTEKGGRPQYFYITDYGAKGDSATLNTHQIQAAIDDCANTGGGRVIFLPGIYKTGTLYFKNNVYLYLQSGATILGSENLENYPVTHPKLRSYTDNYTERSLIYAEKNTNIGIIGEGIIDGQGAVFSGDYKQRPYMIRMIECENVAIRDVTIKIPQCGFSTI